MTIKTHVEKGFEELKSYFLVVYLSNVKGVDHLQCEAQFQSQLHGFRIRQGH